VNDPTELLNDGAYAYLGWDRSANSLTIGAEGSTWTVGDSLREASLRGYCFALLRDGTTQLFAVHPGSGAEDIQEAVDWVEANATAHQEPHRPDAWLTMPTNYADGTEGPVEVDEYIDIDGSVHIHVTEGYLDHRFETSRLSGVTFALINFGGDYGEETATTSLSADAVGTDTISVADTSGFSVGDLITIQNEDDETSPTKDVQIGSVGRGIGEPGVIRSIDSGADTITLRRTLEHFYETANNPVVKNFGKHYGSVSNLAITMPQSRNDNEDVTKGVRFMTCIEPTITNSYFENIVVTAAAFTDSYDARVTRSTFRNNYNDADNGYGISSTGATRLYVTECHISRSRHAIATYGAPNEGGTPSVVAWNNVMSGHGVNHLCDTHDTGYRGVWAFNFAYSENSDTSSNTSNFATNGAYYSEVRGNTVFNLSLVDTRSGPGTTVVEGGEHHIIGNVMYDGGFGLRSDPYRVFDRTHVEGNAFVRHGERGVSVANGGEYYVRNNYFHGEGDGSDSDGVRIDFDVDFFSVEGNTFVEQEGPTVRVLDVGATGGGDPSGTIRYNFSKPNSQFNTTYVIDNSFGVAIIGNYAENNNSGTFLDSKNGSDYNLIAHNIYSKFNNGVVGVGSNTVTTLSGNVAMP
jgi:hypothetical protein